MLSVLYRQCLNLRVDDTETLAKEVAAWELERDKSKVTIQWQFGKNKAREKLHRHYLTTHN
jgi:hypothetical protein